MLRAWKKEVCAGSRPVGPLGIVQLHGAMTPALAAAGEDEAEVAPHDRDDRLPLGVLTILSQVADA